MNLFEKFFGFIKSAFSEPDGSGSSSRLLAGACVVALIVWVSYLVFKNHAMPDLGGAALFLTASFSGYAVNQLSRMNKADPPQQ
jgi:hypothetical protein